MVLVKRVDLRDPVPSAREVLLVVSFLFDVRFSYFHSLQMTLSIRRLLYAMVQRIEVKSGSVEGSHKNLNHLHNIRLHENYYALEEIPQDFVVPSEESGMNNNFITNTR
jgi:hypothetical protein